jgi:hypothetical protein
MSKDNTIVIRLTHQTWKRLNQEREPRDTFEDIVKRVLDERDRYIKMLKQEVGVEARGY